MCIFTKGPNKTIDWKCIDFFQLIFSDVAATAVVVVVGHSTKMNFGYDVFHVNLQRSLQMHLQFFYPENACVCMFMDRCRCILPAGCCIIQCFQGNINQFIELQLADFNYKIPFS